MRNIICKVMLWTVCLTAGVGALAQNPLAPKEAVIVSGNARFTVLTPEMIRIEYSDKGAWEDRATFAIVNRHLDNIPSFKTREDGKFLYITTDRLSLKYRKGAKITKSPEGGDALSITMQIDGKPVTWYPGKPDPLNLKGTCRTLDGANADERRKDLEDSVISRSGWAVIDDSPDAVRADGSRSFAFEPNDTVGYDWWARRADREALDLYFMGYGKNYKKAIGDFTRIAGRVPLPPAYVFGYWYSRYYSYSADDYRQIMRDIAENEIPADVMILDMDWHWNGKSSSQSADIGGWTGWSWNNNLIPDPSGLLGEMHDRNFRIALNLHPADGVDSVESPRYFATMTHELGGKYTRDGRIDWSLDYPDFTNAFFNTVIRDHEAEGVDFWWIDWQQHLTSRLTDGLGQTFWCNHVFFNDMSRNRPERRPVIFHRWGGLGSHRYQIGFSGDALINFPTLAFEPYFTSTASNVGYGFWGHDLGGHAFTDSATVNDPELMLRWIQFGVFTPIFRSHATDDSRIERRIWKFPNFPQLREAVRLRYTLFPYIYTMARATYDTGIGMCRPLYYEYPDCKEAYRYEGEYFFGDDILVAPITAPAPDGKTVTKEIWFPEGCWWSVPKGELIEGPCVKTMAFSADEIPYFYRQGAIIPLNAPGVMNVTTPAKSMVLDIVAGKNGSGSLYEDAGDNPDYATAYATTALRHEADGRVESYIIAPRQGCTRGLVDRRSWKLRILNARQPQTVTLNGRLLSAPAWSYLPDAGTLVIDIPGSPCSSANEVKVTY